MTVAVADRPTRTPDVQKQPAETDYQYPGIPTTCDGAEAVEMAEDVRPDVVLMDVSMPGLDGLEATYALKAQLPDVTVLMLSVGDKEQEIAAGLAGGASEYLVKGGPAREIVDSVEPAGAQVVVLGLTTAAAGRARERELKTIVSELPAGVELWVGGRGAERHASIIRPRGVVLSDYNAYQQELVRIGGRIA